MSNGPVEEFTVSGGGEVLSPAAEVATAGPTRRPWRGPAAWVSCAVVLVLIGVVLTRPLNIGVEPWGVVADVTSAPREAWTERPADEIRSALLADGVLITAGNQTVRGLDPGSGEGLWQLPMVGARCTTDSENLVCTDIASQVLQIDPHSGEATALDIPNAIMATVVDGDVFAVTRGEQGQVQRLRDGEVLWSTPVTLADSYGASRATLDVIAGHVLTTLVIDENDFGVFGAVLDGETGEQWQGNRLYTLNLAPGVWVALEDDGATLFVRGEDEPVKTGGPRTQLLHDDQWRSSEVVTTSDGSFGVRDRHSGEWLWRGEPVTYPIARTGGVVFSLVQDGESTDLQGLSSSSGELLWERAGTWLTCPCLSDGSTLAAYVHAESPDGTRSTNAGLVMGLDARSGERLWELRPRAGMFAMLTEGRHLVLVSPWQLSGWRLG